MRASEAAFWIQDYKEALASFWGSDDAFSERMRFLAYSRKTVKPDGSCPREYIPL
jgi:hypothetical protein